MRLTAKEKIKELSTLKKYNVLMTDNNYIELKLGQLEDIEEELGVELITLFKALKDGIWTKGGYLWGRLMKEPIFIERPEIGMRSLYEETDENYMPIVEDKNVMCIYTYAYENAVYITRIKDYGKTWALTREELENEKD